MNHSKSETHIDAESREILIKEILPLIHKAFDCFAYNMISVSMPSASAEQLIKNEQEKFKKCIFDCIESASAEANALLK